MRAGATRGPGAARAPVGRVATPAALAAAAALASGCINIDLKPKELIGETVAVGKSAYRTLRRKLDGTEERLYTHTVPVEGEVNEHEAGIACLAYLHGIADAAAKREARVLEESTELLVREDGRAMRCSLRAEV